MTTPGIGAFTSKDRRDSRSGYPPLSLLQAPARIEQMTESPQMIRIEKMQKTQAESPLPPAALLRSSSDRLRRVSLLRRSFCGTLAFFMGSIRPSEPSGVAAKKTVQDGLGIPPLPPREVKCEFPEHP